MCQRLPIDVMTTCLEVTHDATNSALYETDVEGVEVVLRAGKVQLPLKSFPSPEKAAVVKHVLRCWVESPVVAFAGVAWFSGDLNEAVIETQIVPDAILPGGESFLVIWKPGNMQTY